MGRTSSVLVPGTERFFRAGYNASLLSDWLPALDGVVDKLKPEAGSPMLDAGTG